MELIIKTLVLFCTIFNLYSQELNTSLFKQAATEYQACVHIDPQAVCIQQYRVYKLAIETLQQSLLAKDRANYKQELKKINRLYSPDIKIIAPSVNADDLRYLIQISITNLNGESGEIDFSEDQSLAFQQIGNDFHVDFRFDREKIFEQEGYFSLKMQGINPFPSFEGKKITLTLQGDRKIIQSDFYDFYNDKAQNKIAFFIPHKDAEQIIEKLNHTLLAFDISNLPRIAWHQKTIFHGVYPVGQIAFIGRDKNGRSGGIYFEINRKLLRDIVSQK